MKKFTPFLALTLVALWLVALTVSAQDCDFTPDALPGQSADRTAYEVDATMHVGDQGGCSMIYGSMNDLTSSNTSAVQVFRGMTLSFIAVGKADVTYTEKVFLDRENFCTTDHTVHYTVEKGTPVARYYKTGADQTKITITEDRIVVYGNAGAGGGGDDGGGGAAGGGGGAGTGIGGDGATGEGGGSGSYSYTTPSLEISIKVYNEGRGTFTSQPITEGITYNSSNPAVATIDANGQVTVTGSIGETTISATWAGNDDWNAVTASYVLHAKKQPTIYFDPYQGTDTVGNVLKLAPVIGTPGVTIDAWESSRPEVATVDENGNVTMVHFGTAQIDAIFNGNSEYHSARARFYLTVSKRQPHISFTPEVIRLEKSVGEFLPPTMNKPDDLTETYSSTYEWHADDPYNVASVDAETGAITLNGGTGTATIIYVFKGDDKYLAQNARYYIEVSTSGITVMGTLATTANNGDIFGDGSVIYTVEPESGNKYLTLQKDTFDANGGVFIESGAFLSIRVNGNCVIKNAAKAINSSSAVFIWCENRKDTIKVEASHTAISAAEMKIHDCYLFVDGGEYGLRNTSGPIAVSAGGYVFAHGGTEAIHARAFTKGEDNIGGIDIMTKGVEFVSWLEAADNFGGFYSDYSKEIKAKDVELGKVPLPVKEDEVTDITFDGEGENPDENLDVVFSSSKDDTFNETEGQIEINTTTDDETLENTLTALVTCSAEWLKKLPGVLVFDVPAGEGQFQIQCEVAAGFHAEAYIEGVGRAEITSPKAGWIQVSYNVVAQTHVILYLQADGEQSAAPARVKAKKAGEPGLAIKAIKITPKDAPTGVEEITNDQSRVINKVIREAQLLIIRDGKIYTITGQQVQ